MNNELFEREILFKSLSQIMENQKKIMRHFRITQHDSCWGYDDNHTRELISECDGIANNIRNELDKEEDNNGWDW